MAYGTSSERSHTNRLIKQLQKKKHRTHAETIQLFDALYTKAFFLYQEIDLHAIKYSDRMWNNCLDLRRTAQLAVDILYALPLDTPGRSERIWGLHADKCSEIATACYTAIHDAVTPPGDIYDPTPSALEKFTLVTPPLPHKPKSPYPGAFAECKWQALDSMPDTEMTP